MGVTQRRGDRDRVGGERGRRERPFLRVGFSRILTCFLSIDKSKKRQIYCQRSGDVRIRHFLFLKTWLYQCSHPRVCSTILFFFFFFQTVENLWWISFHFLLLVFF